jgi:hypothetical protein
VRLGESGFSGKGVSVAVVVVVVVVVVGSVLVALIGQYGGATDDDGLGSVGPVCIEVVCGKKLNVLAAAEVRSSDCLLNSAKFGFWSRGTMRGLVAAVDRTRDEGGDQFVRACAPPPDSPGLDESTVQLK